MHSFTIPDMPSYEMFSNSLILDLHHPRSNSDLVETRQAELDKIALKGSGAADNGAQTAAKIKLRDIIKWNLGSRHMDNRAARQQTGN